MKTSGSISPVINLKYSYAETIALAKQALPTQFRGFNKYYPEVVQAFRLAMQNSNYGDFEDFEYHVLMHNAHIPALKVLLEDLQAYIIHNNTDFVTTKRLSADKFLQEISVLKASDNIQWSKVFLLHVRYALSARNQSLDDFYFCSAFDFFIFHMQKSLLDNNAFLNHEQTLASIKKHIHPDQVLYQAQDHLSMLVDKNLSKYFPSNIIYPITGYGKFGLTFMIYCYLANVLVCGLPYKNARAHGLSLSPFAFMLHDFVHSRIDCRRYMLRRHILNESNRLVEKGGGAEEFIKYYTPVATYRYVLLMNAFKQLVDLFLNKLLPKYGMHEYTKAIAGLFFIFHESASWNEEVFQEKDLKTIILTLVTGAIKSQSSSIKHNTLQTSPVDGSSSLTDEQIYEDYLQNSLKYTLPVDGNEGLPLDFEKNLEKFKNNLAKKQIIKTKNFIEVIFESNNGKKYNYYHETMYYQFCAINDDIDLLKICGIHVLKPDLSKLLLEQASKAAIETIEQVRKKLRNLMRDFARKALFFIELKTDTSLSIAEEYFVRQFNLQQKIDQDLTNMLREKDHKSKNMLIFSPKGSTKGSPKATDASVQQEHIFNQPQDLAGSVLKPA